MGWALNIKLASSTSSWVSISKDWLVRKNPLGIRLFWKKPRATLKSSCLSGNRPSTKNMVGMMPSTYARRVRGPPKVKVGLVAIESWIRWNLNSVATVKLYFPPPKRRLNVENSRETCQCPPSERSASRCSLLRTVSRWNYGYLQSRRHLEPLLEVILWEERRLIIPRVKLASPGEQDGVC